MSHAYSSALRTLPRALVAGLTILLSSGTSHGAELAQAPGAARPNILFIIFDDWGWNHASAYGCTWVKTPNFDRVAREGILFRSAFTSNPKCSPCRASILTGRNTWQLEEASCHNGLFPSKFAVYPDLLEQAGYVVGLTGKGWGPGDFRSTGFKRNPAGPSFDEFTTQPPASGIGRLDYAKNFEAFLKQRPAGKPFCFWMGFQEPHRGYELNSGVRMGKQVDAVKVPAYLPDLEVVRSDLLDYSVEVEYADSYIGRALEVLTAAGELDNTLIVITSDHGMPFPHVKGQIFEDGFHLPLAMRWGRGIKPGRVVDDFINVRDFAPTFMELAGLMPHQQMTGRSLTNILKSEQSGWVERRDVMLVGKERHDLGRPYDWGYPVRAIRTPEFLYIHNYFPDRWPAGNPETDFGNCDPSPTKELLKAIGGEFYEISFGKRPENALYRLTDDPECVRNLAHDPAFAQTMEELRTRMLSMLREEQDPRALGNGAIFDTYKYLAGRAKGYDTWLSAQTFKPQEPPARANRPRGRQKGKQAAGASD
jgi:arylsulfatase A-like enzyme